MFRIQNLSTKYVIKKLTRKDIPILLELADGNPYYYKHVPPALSKESFLKDMKALPPKTTAKDKFYVGFYEENELIAILDLIFNYPNSHTVFIGFFMMNKKYQRKGLGTQIIQELLSHLPSQYIEVRLGISKTNEISRKFWQKNSFKLTGEKYRQPLYIVLIMNRKLG